MTSQADDEIAIKKLALLYARAMDHTEPQRLLEIFTADGVIDVGGSVRATGHAELAKIPGGLKEKYAATLHKIHNQLVLSVKGDSAEGETYCTADHLQADRGGFLVYTMAIRYEDQLARSQGTWRFARRRLTVEYTEVRQAQRTPR
jgi:ketosteroid isomerase-like protein